jgi:hypothetical protein
VNLNPFNLFRTNSSTVRSIERQVLVVPVHEDVDKEYKQAEVQKVLAKAAEQIANSGLLWKWINYDTSVKMCYWSKAEKAFLRGSLIDWAFFFGDNWIVRDSNNVPYRGPSPIVTDRLIAAVLAHPDTPIANWALQLQMKMEAVK